MSLASALLVIAVPILNASAEEPNTFIDGTVPRKHSLSASLGITPLYIGEALLLTPSDSFYGPESPVLTALSGDYTRSFGLVRLGAGLRYTHTWDMNPKRGRGWSFAHELGIRGTVGLGGTTKSGVDIAATLGLVIGHDWIPNFKMYPSGWGVAGELLVSVAIPVVRDADVLLSTGINMGLYSGSDTGEKDPDSGYIPEYDGYLKRIYIPLEVGYRKRF